jgi:hypothetical protein
MLNPGSYRLLEQARHRLFTARQVSRLAGQGRNSDDAGLKFGSLPSAATAHFGSIQTIDQDSAR